MSVVNCVLASSTKGQPTPEIGMGATALYFSDRHAMTIVGVTHDKQGNVKSVLAQRDIARRVDKNGMSEVQRYEFQRDENAHVEEFSLRKTGRYVRVSESTAHGLCLRIGERDEYHDFSY